MAEIIYQSNLIQLCFEKQLNLFEYVWQPATASISPDSAEMDFYKLLDFIAQIRPELVLANNQKFLAPISVDKQKMVATKMIDILNKSNVKKYAIVHSKEFIVDLSIDQTLQEAAKITDKRNYCKKIFNSREEAYQWLVEDEN